MTLRSIKGRIVAVFLITLVFFAATKIRTPEIVRAGEELRSCQYDAGSVATVGHLFALQTNHISTYALPSAKKVRRLSSVSFIPDYRAPPRMFPSVTLL
jgi:hypothetical protein